MKSGQFFLTMPSQIVRAKGWKKGNNIGIEINMKGDIVLKQLIDKLQKKEKRMTGHIL